MTSQPLEEAEIRHGTKVGRFVVVGELGAGGMGVVYAAHDRELDRRIALKVLRGTVASDEERIRMLREGQAMARVTHPNVITVYEVGIEGSLVFLAQELLDGGTLGAWLESPRPQHAIVDKFVAAGRGLAAAHAAGLVHRDFKPDNVLLGKDGRVRVSDFGLARALGPHGEALALTTPGKSQGQPASDRSESPMSSLTRTGAVMGTPMFMAPEQHNGESADERSDQFSFCVALYHALYGDWPFAGKTAVALADAVIHGRMQAPPKGHRVPARLRRILLRGLRTQRADRYPSIDALLADLTHEPARRLRWVALAAGIVVLVGGAVVGGYTLRTRTAAVPLPPVPVVAPPPVTPDLKNLTGDRAIQWLSSAMERGQLEDAAEKFDMAGALKLQAGQQPEAAIAWSAGVFALVLRGRLEEAQVRLRDVDANKGQDPTALAYADMATAALASGRGDLPVALARSRQCAAAFAAASPILAALCWQLNGDTAAAMGDGTAARAAYESGRAIARRAPLVKRPLTLELGVSQLDLDEGEDELAATTALAVQPKAAERDAVSTEAHAWVVLARARLAQAASQKALEVLEQVKPATLQLFQLRLRYKLTLGQTHASLGDATEALALIDAARAEAEKQGTLGLVLEARLARVEVLVATGAADAQAELGALVRDAGERGYGRIVRLAETLTQR